MHETTPWGRHEEGSAQASKAATKASDNAGASGAEEEEGIETTAPSHTTPRTDPAEQPAAPSAETGSPPHEDKERHAAAQLANITPEGETTTVYARDLAWRT